jgi:hypothetical protein
VASTGTLQGRDPEVASLVVECVLQSNAEGFAPGEQLLPGRLSIAPDTVTL